MDKIAKRIVFTAAASAVVALGAVAGQVSALAQTGSPTATGTSGSYLTTRYRALDLAIDAASNRLDPLCGNSYKTELHLEGHACETNSEGEYRCSVTLSCTSSNQSTMCSTRYCGTRENILHSLGE